MYLPTRDRGYEEERLNRHNHASSAKAGALFRENR